jgi:ABC-type transport system involved in multi-copper enzyme maturation permease subunit
MWKRWGTGPVFAFETLVNARRWQVYAGRSLFVLMVLAGMTVVWVTSNDYTPAPGPRLRTYQQMAKLGEWFFYAMAGIQVSLVMLAAPAATAGSICMDRARGTLAHMLMTDLSDVEIVLGKLGARLVPIIGMIACGVPVAALSALLGGIEFGAIAGLFVVSLSLAVLGCTLAITISVWATKTHEVLMVLYTFEGLWLLALPLWWSWTTGGKIMPPPDWFQKANPYVIVFAPYNQPGFVGTGDYVGFTAIVLVLSIGLAVLSVAKLRRVVVEQSGRPQKLGLRLPRLKRIFPSWAGPSLDGNPVLWREWHRTQPSRLMRILWVTMLMITWILAAWGTYELINEGQRTASRGLSIGMLLQLLFGMLFLSATAPTALAEERVRGSLDLLMTTPLSTRSIVVGKWLGVLRCVFVLVLLPLYAAIFMAGSMPDTPAWVARFPQMAVVPLTAGDHILAVTFCAVDFVVSCALLVSLGLLIATWVRRLGRAVALSVIAYFLSGIGWIVLVEFVGNQILRHFRMTGQSPGMDDRYRWLQTCALSFSPIAGSFNPIAVLEQFSTENRAPIWNTIGIVILTKAVIAGVLLWLTIKTFDRCMGRMSEPRFRARTRKLVVFNELAGTAS